MIYKKKLYFLYTIKQNTYYIHFNKDATNITLVMQNAKAF